MAVTYQTEGVKMPDIKKPLMERDSVKSPIFSVRTKKY